MRYKFTAACPLAALLLGAPSVSATIDTERQLDTIAGADNAWNAVLGELAEADSSYMDFAPNDNPTLAIAVTDLDDNGRLEVIFCTSRKSGEGVAVARENKQSEEYIEALDSIAFVPLSVHALIYEVTEDGSALAHVSYEHHNGDLTPDFPNLTQLKEPQSISAEMGAHASIASTPSCVIHPQNPMRAYSPSASSTIRSGSKRARSTPAWRHEKKQTMPSTRTAQSAESLTQHM